MTKLRVPIFSLDASGPVGKAITYLKRRGQDIAEKKPHPRDVHTVNQLAWRTMYQACTDLWHLLSSAEKQAWESAGTTRHMTGYAWYMSQCLRPNPGIYLPLAGGTMQGTIVMGSNQITGLPDPATAQEPATKAYADALDRGEGHITILPWNYNSIGLGTWELIPYATQWAGFFWQNSTVVDGENISYKVTLTPGTYTLRLLIIKALSGAILDVDIDSVEVASFDSYNATTLVNQTVSQTGIVIATPGIKTLTLRIDGKNPSATEYKSHTSSIALWRTA